MTLGLAIVGYGRMGRLVEQFAPEYGFDVRAKFTNEDNRRGVGLTPAALRGIDVAVEFSTSEAVTENIRKLAEAGLDVAVGTTGWLSDLPVVQEVITQSGTGLVWAANFSIGVNLFVQAAAHAAALFANQHEYGAWGWEIHHDAKRDAPSGTLRRLAEEMRTSGYLRPIGLSANRAGANPGTHEIGFDSAEDTITLRHTARNREGFARGALRAARWIGGKKGLFEFKEILGDLVSWKEQ